MICPACGNFAPEGTVFCPACSSVIPPEPELPEFRMPARGGPRGEGAPGQAAGTGSTSQALAHWVSEYAMVFAIAVAGALYFRIIAEMLVRMFAQKSISLSTSFQVLASNTVSVLGLAFGATVVAVASLLLGGLVGNRYREHGALMGAIMAVILCAIECLLSLLRVGSIARITELVTGKPGFNWGYFMAAFVLITVLSSFAGWLGSSTNLTRMRESPFSVVATAASIVLIAILLAIGVTGTIVTAERGGSSEGVRNAFVSMNAEEGWVADIYSVTRDGEKDFLAKILYQKGMGYSLQMVDPEGEGTIYYSLTPEGKGYLFYSKYSEEWEPTRTQTGVDIFNPEKADRFQPGESHGGKLFNQKAVYHEVKGDPRDYAFVDLLTSQIQGAPLLALKNQPFSGVVWTDGDNKRVLCFNFLLFERGTPDETTEPGSAGAISLVFSRFGEKTLEGTTFIPKP